MRQKINYIITLSVVLILCIISVYILAFRLEWTRHPFTSQIVDKDSIFAGGAMIYTFYLVDGYNPSVSSIDYNDYEIGDNYTYYLWMWKWK